MKTLLLLLALSGPWGFQKALLFFTGASCVEELSEDEIQRYQTLATHPVDLNAAGRSRLLATGLLTPYQVASLLDYRERSGAVLSWTELGLVDGFTPDRVAALQAFAVLGEPTGAPGQREDRRLHQSLTLRGGVRTTVPAAGASGTGPAAAAGLKYELAVGERAELFYSNRITYSAPEPGWGTVSAAYYGRQALGQLIVGHFQARFGQGLVQWSGFSLSGYNSLGAFRRNGTGFSPTGSYAPSLFGVASDWHFGKWRLSAGYAPGQPILNLTRNWRRLSAGVTATGTGASLEVRVSLPSWALFGEAAVRYALGLSAVAGVLWVPAYGHRAGFVGRWLGRGKEYNGLALGYEGPALSCTADAAVRPDTRAFQLKSLLQWHPSYVLSGRSPAPVSPKSSSPSDPEIHRGSSFRLIDHPITLQPLLRLQLRYRPSEAVAPSTPAASTNSDTVSPFAGAGVRLDIRGMVTATRGPWILSGRYDAVLGRGFAWNWYAELGWKPSEAFSVYGRGGIFKVDDWDDRIYVYERDAPGNFSVPAYSGKGISLQGMAGYKLRLGKWTLKAYLRGGYMIRVQKEPSPTLAVQLQVQR